MKQITIFAIFFAIVINMGISDQLHKKRWEFNDLDEWQDDSQNNSPKSYVLANGKLRISTRKQTKDRVKIRTIRRYGTGEYTWRVYAPTMGKGDQASVGAFLYKDDTHEVDFEIGFGTASIRDELKAKNDDLVCYCTSQGFPESTSQVLVKKEAWYTLSIKITCSKNGNYLIKWFVNGEQAKQLQTDFGSEISFTIHCSVENLVFMGDHIPTQESYALFDYVEFRPYQSTPNQPDTVTNVDKPHP